MKCDACPETDSCKELCPDMEDYLPKSMRFEEIPVGGASEMDNIVQRYIEQSNCPTIHREVSPDLFKIGIDVLNKLSMHQHIILYLYHVAGVNDRKIAYFFKTHKGNINQSRKAAYKKIRRLTDGRI